MSKVWLWFRCKVFQVHRVNEASDDICTDCNHWIGWGS